MRKRYYRGGPIQKAVAIELLYTLRDCTDSDLTVQFIDSLPNDLRSSPLVKEQHTGSLPSPVITILRLEPCATDPDRRRHLGTSRSARWAV